MPNAGFHMTRLMLSTPWMCSLVTCVHVVHVIPKAGLENLSGRRYGTSHIRIFFFGGGGGVGGAFIDV